MLTPNLMNCFLWNLLISILFNPLHSRMTSSLRKFDIYCKNTTNKLFSKLFLGFKIWSKISTRTSLKNESDWLYVKVYAANVPGAWFHSKKACARCCILLVQEESGFIEFKEKNQKVPVKIDSQHFDRNQFSTQIYHW